MLGQLMALSCQRGEGLYSKASVGEAPGRLSKSPLGLFPGPSSSNQSAISKTQYAADWLIVPLISLLSIGCALCILPQIRYRVSCILVEEDTIHK